MVLLVVGSVMVVRKYSLSWARVGGVNVFIMSRSRFAGEFVEVCLLVMLLFLLCVGDYVYIWYFLFLKDVVVL